MLSLLFVNQLVVALLRASFLIACMDANGQLLVTNNNLLVLSLSLSLGAMWLSTTSETEFGNLLYVSQPGNSG